MPTSAATAVQAGDHRVRLTSLDKVYYPAAGFTKGQVLNYYASAAPTIIRHLRSRPLVLKRYPEGVEGDHFYQKECPSSRPDWVQTADVVSSRDGTTKHHCLANDLASLLWLVNQGCLEFHAFLATTEDLERPRMMVYDLDPGPGTTLRDVCQVALTVRDALADDELEALVKVSGKKGIHVHVALDGRAPFDDVRSYARSLAGRQEAAQPDRVTANMRKERRRGRIFIDWSQNSRHKATACAYSLRAAEHPQVAMPVRWREIEEGAEGETERLRFAPQDVSNRLDAHGDLFEPVLGPGQGLPST